MMYMNALAFYKSTSVLTMVQSITLNYAQNNMGVHNKQNRFHAQQAYE